MLSTQVGMDLTKHPDRIYLGAIQDRLVIGTSIMGELSGPLVCVVYSFSTGVSDIG